eukprot:5775881-Alexandrium_andersonii.AAC.1
MVTARRRSDGADEDHRTCSYPQHVTWRPQAARSMSRPHQQGSSTVCVVHKARDWQDGSAMQC